MSKTKKGEKGTTEIKRSGGGGSCMGRAGASASRRRSEYPVAQGAERIAATAVSVSAARSSAAISKPHLDVRPCEAERTEVQPGPPASP